MNDQMMAHLPKWIQEIAERESKATEGPWDRCEAECCPCGNVYKTWDDDGNVFSLVSTTGGVDHEGVNLSDDLRRANAAFIAHARTDVPKLIELVGEMGEAIGDAAEVLQEHVEGESVLIERLWRLWEKYRGEVESGSESIGGQTDNVTRGE